MNSTQNYGNDKILSWKSDSSEVQMTESESENPRLTKGETRYCIFDKYKLIFVSLEIFSMGETEEVIDHRRTLRLELADIARPPIQVRPSPAAFSGFSRWLLSTFQALAIRVANALRKLRYHQLCSPASLPTEWTQSGSLSSESSFRWFLFVRTHSLTDRKMAH